MATQDAWKNGEAVMTKQRVLMIAPTPFFSDYGNSVRILEEIRSVKSEPVEIQLCTYGVGRQISGVTIHRIPDWFGPITPGFFWRRVLVDICLLFLVVWQTLKYRPNVVHGHLHTGAAIGMVCLWLRLGRCRLIADVQGSLLEEITGSLDTTKLSSKLVHMAERLSLKAAHYVVASSPGLASTYLSQFGMRTNKIRVLADVCNSSIFRVPSDKEREIARNVYSFSEDDVVFVYVGLLSQLQGFDLLLESFSKANSDQPHIKLLLAGYSDGRLDPSLMRSAETHRSVVWLGKLSYGHEVAQVLRAADIGISPKRKSTQSNGKVLNYMGSGLRTVVFDNETNRFLLGSTGYYAQHETVDCLSQMILEATRDHERQARAWHNPERVANQMRPFTSETMRKQLLDLWNGRD